MMKIDLYMKTIEGFSRGYFYDVNNGFEIMYKEPYGWRVRKKIPYAEIQNGATELKWHRFNIENFDAELTLIGIDLNRLERMLMYTLLTHANYCNMIIDKIRKTVGDEQVEKSFEDQKAFGAALVGAIDKTLRRSKLSLVKDLE